LNALGDTTARGGFDPILSLFDGTGAELYEQDDAGCGDVAADLMTGRCYDVRYKNALAAGTYTVTVQQFNNFATGSKLADGFVDSAGDKRDAHCAAGRRAGTGVAGAAGHRCARAGAAQAYVKPRRASKHKRVTCVSA